MLRHSLRTVPLLVLLLGATARAGETPPPVRFSRDILPILSENCFQCHGPDEAARKAKLRLDTKDGIQKVLVAKQSGASELVRRINAAADDGRMPPPKANRKLTSAQQELLRRWIDEGAAWDRHWAYEPPLRPA